MNKKKIVFLSLFFVVLFAGFYLAVRRFIPEVPQPLSKVPPFFFKDQEGRLVTDRDLAGKVYVAEYFFTTCKGICPKLNTNMKDVARDFAAEADFRLLSYTVDPETDSVARMKVYADSMGADPTKWFFLTGRKDSLYLLARNGYLLDDPKNNVANINDQFLHTQFVALVDKNGKVRKIYDGLKKDELADMEKDIRSLLREKATAPRFANGLFNNNPG